MKRNATFMERTPTIYIRVDANQEIATGHVMRTLAIAKQIKKLGGQCKFIVADEYPVSIIKNNGFEAVCLQSKWDDLEEEMNQIEELIERLSIQVLLVDSYFVTKNYLEYLKNKVYVVYIDDLNLLQYPVHLLINYSLYYEQFDYEGISKNQKTQFLLGCDYIPLREEFMNRKRNNKESITDILITTGGTDSYHIAYTLLKQMLQEGALKEVNLHVVLGPFNHDVEYIKELENKYANIKVHQDIQYMSDLMMQCDIGISAGGTTLFELCACGLPTICFAIADNQMLGIKTLSEQGFMSSIGDIREDVNSGVNEIIKKVQYLSQSLEVRENYSQKMQALVDGKGAERIARYLLAKK